MSNVASTLRTDSSGRLIGGHNGDHQRYERRRKDQSTSMRPVLPGANGARMWSITDQNPWKMHRNTIRRWLKGVSRRTTM